MLYTIPHHWEDWSGRGGSGRQPNTGQKGKDEHIGRFKLFLLREINTMYEFLCTPVMPFMLCTTFVKACVSFQKFIYFINN